VDRPFATQPATANENFQDQADALSDPALRQLYLDYDRAHDLEPSDPFIATLAQRIVTASVRRYGTQELPAKRRTQQSHS
jgi:hypothetical protein